MSYVLFGVPSQASPTGSVVAGVYLRMGTYVNDDPAIIEAGYMAHTYTGGASASEGIFIASSGTYIVTALDEGHIELLNGATMTVTTGAVTTTVEDGNVSMTVNNGPFLLQGKSAYKVTSEHGDIDVVAENGKVSTKGHYVYNHTFGAYIKMTAGAKKSGITQTSTNVSVSLNISIYLAVLVTGVMSSLSLTFYNESLKGFILSVGGIQFDFNVDNSMWLEQDWKFSFIYLKFRGIQLEEQVVKANNSFLKTKSKLADAKKAIAEVKNQGVKNHNGIMAKFP